jgi:inosine/xanthosine triphosphatase
MTISTVLVASSNPVKLEAARRGFERMFPAAVFRLETISVPSGVADQPASDAETLQGALGRVTNAAHQRPKADFWVGIEGGVAVLGDELAAFAWVAILGGERGGRLQLGKSRTGTFFLPPGVARLVQSGVELGEADDRIFNRSNSKQENGAIGLLTENVVDRAALYEQAVILALVPFCNPELYAESG